MILLVNSCNCRNSDYDSDCSPSPTSSVGECTHLCPLPAAGLAPETPPPQDLPVGCEVRGEQEKKVKDRSKEGTGLLATYRSFILSSAIKERSRVRDRGGGVGEGEGEGVTPSTRCTFCRLCFVPLTTAAVSRERTSTHSY